MNERVIETWECMENDTVIDYDLKAKEFLVRTEGEPKGTGIVIGDSDMLYALTMMATIPLDILR